MTQNIQCPGQQAAWWWWTWCLNTCEDDCFWNVGTRNWWYSWLYTKWLVKKNGKATSQRTNGIIYTYTLYIYIFYINPRYSYKRRPHFFIILISYRIPLPFSGQKLPPQNFPLMRGTNVDLPASMERLLVPTKSWAQRIGIRKTCLGFSLKKVDGTGIGWVF